MRAKEFGSLKHKLLDAKGDAVAITAALRGAGGYGKTTLAKALAHDPDIHGAFFDGILWVELGEKPENLLGVIADLITLLTGSPPGLETINSAATALGEAPGERRILLIVDDAWREQDLRPFLQGGPRATRLVTTRIDAILPDTAHREKVDAMRDEEALRLLTAGLPNEDVGTERAASANSPRALANGRCSSKSSTAFCAIVSSGTICGCRRRSPASMSGLPPKASSRLTQETQPTEPKPSPEPSA